MNPADSKRLNYLFAGSTVAIVLLVGVAISRELRRPVFVEQRIVTELDVVDRCETCHDAAEHSGVWLEQHAVERFGCTPCHGGQGLATTREGAHDRAPDWERPLFTALEREAACGTCHQGTTVPGAPLLSRGRKALEERGCAGCHELPGYSYPAIAPALDGVREKLSPGWVRGWLKNDVILDPLRRMPAFTLSAEQIEALGAYLFSLTGLALEPMPASLEGDADRGRSAVGKLRCATCHQFEGRGGTFGPNLDLAGVKNDPIWFWNYLTDTHRLQPQTRMPGFHIAPEEAADIVAYAVEQWVPDTETTAWAQLEAPVQAEHAAPGRALFTELGCRGCHGAADVAPERNGMMLGTFGDRRIGDLPHGSGLEPPPDIPSWVAAKVLEPRGFDVPGARPSKMPAYTMDREEALAIGVAVAAMRATSQSASYVTRTEVARTPVPAGETGRIVDRYRCLVCHRLEDVGGDISRVPLDGEGARVQRAWLERFLIEPVTLRMDQAERMPVLGLSEQEAARLASWIDAALGDDRIPERVSFESGDIEAGKKLYLEQGCPQCHMAEGAGTMKGPVLDGASDRLKPGYVLAMLRLGSAVVPEGRHPEGVWSEAEARVIAAYVCSLPPAGEPE